MGMMCKRKWVEAIYLNPMVWDKVYICPRPKINVKLNNERPIRYEHMSVTLWTLAEMEKGLV